MIASKKRQYLRSLKIKNSYEINYLWVPFLHTALAWITKDWLYNNLLDQLFFFFLVRKMGPEPTTVANLPVVTWGRSHWATHLCQSSSIFHTWDAVTARLDERCVGLCPGSKPGAAKVECMNLTTMPVSQPLAQHFLSFRENTKTLHALNQLISACIYVAVANSWLSLYG